MFSVVQNGISGRFNNSVVGITGGTGSFGKTLVNFLLKNTTAEIKVLSRDERKQDQMRRSLVSSRVKFMLGDVRDRDSLTAFCNQTNYIFHAAALKQVPSCEFFPMEAVKTNVLGTENVLKQAEYHGVDSVVCLSTDKAVYPINAMGISKALMEKVARALSRDFENTRVCITRYGNVMGSRGSVIPIFCNQISQNRPATITNGSMTRFLMNLDESVGLVLKAFIDGGNGDLFVQKSPACTIEALAGSVAEYYGKELFINNIGVRHGEKQYETLLSKEEFSTAEDVGDFYKVAPDSRDLNYDSYYVDGNDSKENILEYNSNNTTQLADDELNKRIWAVIEKGFHD